MATLALSLAGQFVGGAVGGPIGATIGRALGALAGAAVDGALFGERARPVSAGADIRLTGSSEGGAVPRLYGWSRLGGNIIWATELEELAGETSGAKGFGAAEEGERTIVGSFAVAFCEGEVAHLGRVWADGQVLDTDGVTLRFYGGSETQEADSLIEAVQGAGNAPAYRGLCYIVFERLPLAQFGNRVPNIAVELCRVVGELEPQIRAVNVIPGAGEFVYDPVPRVRLVSPGVTASENTHVAAGISDWTVSIDELQALCPNLETVQLVIGVDALIVGTEMKALNAVRGADDTFPFVEALVTLADDVRSVVGPDCLLTYAADWSEVTGYQPGGGAKFFHLDPLWASDAIDAVAIDNYMPIADWRDGTDHADAGDWDSIYGLDYLRAGIAGRDGYDWYYADEADRLDGVRSPIGDDAYGEPWVWRFKDLQSWWLNEHHDRPGGVRSGTPTDWVPGSKPIWFTEIGCGAVDKGANQPSAFGDPKSIENTRPFFSSGAPDALMQRQYLRAQFLHWASDANPVNDDDMPMVDVARIAPWAWDARPYPAFPSQREAWSDWPNYATGHWLNGRLGGLASDELVAAIAADYGVDVAVADAAGPLVTGLSVEAVTSAREAMGPVLAAAGLGVRDTPEGLSFSLVSARAALALDEVAAGDGPLTARTRPDPSEAVGQVAFGYFDRERGYLAASVTAMTQGGGATSAERTALVLDPAGARQAAERLLIDGAAQRDTLEFALPHSVAGLEAGDAVSLAGQGDGPFEITAIRDGAVRRISARAIPPVLDAAIVSDAPRGTPGAAPVRALPLVVAAHLPAEPGQATSRLVVAASASPWPGRVIVNDEVTGAGIGRIDRSAAVGELLEPLAPGPLAVWDMANAVAVTLRSGHLASSEDIAVLAGSNRIAVETDAGWEVVGYAVAELVAPQTYRLTRLLRGQFGTDFAMTGADAGARVIVLDGRPLTADVPAGWLGETVPLRAYAGSADAEGSAFDAELGLGPVLPLAPAHLRAESDADGDVALTWVRRSRFDTDSWTAADAPHDHLPEAYRVTILDGAEPVRVIDATTPGAAYTAAEQAADFGAPPPSFAFAVSQVSPVYGPGHAATGTFNA